MKRINNIYEDLLSYDYVKDIIILASKGKHKRAEVRHVLDNMDEYTNKILDMTEKCKFYMLPVRKSTIYEKTKYRDITISPFFPNRILDYLMTETLKKYIKQSMYAYSVGNVDGRGMIYGKKFIEKKLQKV